MEILQKRLSYQGRAFRPYEYEMAGAMFMNMLRDRRALAQDDIDNPVPADNEYIVHEEKDQFNNVKGRIRMTYLEYLEVWPTLTAAQKKAQLRPVKPKDATTVELPDGTIATTNRKGASFAAKEQEKIIRQKINSKEFFQEGQMLKAKMKKKK